MVAEIQPSMLAAAAVSRAVAASEACSKQCKGAAPSLPCQTPAFFPLLDGCLSSSFYAFGLPCNIGATTQISCWQHSCNGALGSGYYYLSTCRVSAVMQLDIGSGGDIIIHF